MKEVEVILIKKRLSDNEIGVQEEKEEKRIVPIIDAGGVWYKEYYIASSYGIKPSLKIKMMALNYEEEDELEYKKLRYKVIRVDEINTDEISLICEKMVVKR